MRGVIAALQPDFQALRNVQDYFERIANHRDFTNIHTNYLIIASSIVRFEAQGLDLHTSCRIVCDAANNLLGNQAVSNRVKQKLLDVLRNNTDFYSASFVAEACLVNNNFQILPQGWNANDVRHMTFAPLTLCDVERSFNHYKNIFRPNRRSFTCKYLEKCVSVHYNKTLNCVESLSHCQ